LISWLHAALSGTEDVAKRRYSARDIHEDKKEDSDDPDPEIAGMKMVQVRASNAGGDVKPEPDIISDAIILTRCVAEFLA
jgi:hypothetical protein